MTTMATSYLFVSAYFGGNNKNTLYRNQGDGTFTKVGTDKLVSEGGNLDRGRVGRLQQRRVR